MADDLAGREQEGLVLAPFRAVRYRPDRVRDLAAVTSPPYDLVDADAVAELMAADPYNVVRLILPREQTAAPAADIPAADVPVASGARPLPDRQYGHAGATLRRWLSEGVLATDTSPALYVYEQRGCALLQRGLIGAVGLCEDRQRIVLPHEHVYPGPVRDQLRLMRATEANLEPIFLLYEGDGPASDLVDEVAASQPPQLEIGTEDGMTHRLWRLAEPASHARVAADLGSRQALIADGHHRYATYQRLRSERGTPGPWDFGLALLVDSRRYPPQLGAIHRVIPGLATEEAARRAASAFRVEPAPAELDRALESLAAHARRRRTAFLLGGAGGNPVLLTDPDPAQVDRAMPANRSRSWRRLDTSVLHALLIDRIWGIDETRERVHIVHHDPAAALAKARRCGGTAVIVNPPQTADVFAVAAGGERVPRKSTSFGPKPRTGLVLRTFAAG